MSKGKIKKVDENFDKAFDSKIPLFKGKELQAVSGESLVLGSELGIKPSEEDFKKEQEYFANIKVMPGKVVIKPEDQLVSSSIVIDAQPKKMKGVVMAVANNVEFVKPGDTVHWTPLAGHSKVKVYDLDFIERICGGDYLALRQDEIIFVDNNG